MRNNTSDTPPTLREWRASLGLTQDKAAKLLGMPQSRYSLLERGHPISGKRAKHITKATGVPLEVLVGAV